MSDPRWMSSAEMLAELWERVHQNCDAPWYCERCERPVCPRCEPSPGEPRLCPECDWLEGPNDAA